ncbi:MAG: outer membrane protein assembly factor BamD [Campylobacterota bacterium]|nr:outer membrane protein assembly factor BamD [Campylobacterota bacterium]
MLISLILMLLMLGCSKELEEYNKPAAYWYDKMIESVAKGNIEKADSYYSSLQSEHIGSPLLRQATLIMAQAHMYYEEYLLSEHFLNEYIKRYANPIEREYAEYLKIKAKYMALPHPRRDQGLINEAIASGEDFKRSYPRSNYIPVVDTMITRLILARASLNESIAKLYDRLDKPKSAQYYRDIRPEPWIDWDNVQKAQVPFYRSIFEGDGDESWYGFLIPDTQSVVSRHANDDEKVGYEKNVEQEEKMQREMMRPQENNL